MNHEIKYQAHTHTHTHTHTLVGLLRGINTDKELLALPHVTVIT